MGARVARKMAPLAARAGAQDATPTSQTAAAYQPEAVSSARRWVLLGLAAGMTLVGLWGLPQTRGVASYLLATVVVVGGIIAMKAAGELLWARFGISLGALTRLALVAGSVLMTLAGFEVALGVVTPMRKPDDRAGILTALTMPKEWERRPVEVPGAHYAYFWHGFLHVHNRDSMRLVGEFPPKPAGTFRIIALGDSLTYGYGVRAEDAYPAVLERELNRHFRVEVLNLGISGWQSEDVFRTLQEKLPLLRPDLVVYGVCLNDFLPSGIGQYENNRAYEVPLPYKALFVERTLVGKFLDKQYDNLLMKAGVRADFFTDILRDFNGYQRRFARDVRAMNDYVRAHGLPPIVAMVLDQYPNTRAKKHEIVLAAERHLAAAGIRVVAADYVRRHDGALDLYVSPWEGHPNEKAHRIFGEELAREVIGLPQLEPYRHERPR